MTEEHRFPCEQCGADYRYDPARAELVCDHCGDVRAITDPGPWKAGIRELDYRAAVDNLLPLQEMEELQVSKCPNCGAEVEFEPDTHATECPFCATPVVTGTGAHRQIKPRGLLPFALDEKAAHDAMNGWLGRLWFAPNGLKEYARKGRKMQGIYVPYWTFDARTRSEYSGERGTVYYETRQVMRDGKMQTVRVAKVRWRGVSGRVARFFDDVLVLASRSLPKRFTDALEPWDLSRLEPYQPEFLAGFRAEGYQVDLADGFVEARQLMDRQIERDVKFDIGGDRQRIHRVDTQVSEVTFKHILLPVWLAAYKYRGETYRFVVYGTTGRGQGERPWSTWKIALAVIVGLIVAGAIGYVMAQSQ
ncbi:primosomal protein N' (replication factor Y) - superfamily II helicase [Salipiger sp. HF18]|uniref:primosomal protein N' (replication factor Y) - superfamily II helicase n=1 Tax=Salipiger sp. HF18 TaxID=2721557 RepID=UPI00142E669E|nr:primosomal protein N' (replication factor Y) - superfamily II helicase [Salipiger sp. HF18]NIY97567.1 primosomal protein N' (replication factor Y) - superfamily II helicase [Salipiger sp. HF18]